MTDFRDPSTEALALAGGAVASALLDLLIERKVLTADDARKVCRRAQNEIRSLVGISGDAASGLIDNFISRLP